MISTGGIILQGTARARGKGVPQTQLLSCSIPIPGLGECLVLLDSPSFPSETSHITLPTTCGASHI